MSMKVAVVGSRTLWVENLEAFLPKNTTELVSGGAKGVDTCVRRLARQNGWPLTEFLPNYARYGRAAPIKRNEQIVQYADTVVAFWDGCSPGTGSVMRLCRAYHRPLQVFVRQPDGSFAPYRFC